MSIEFYWIAFAAVLVFSGARITRLLTVDKFPPIARMRERFADWSDATPRRREWQLIAFCGYCMGFWVALALLAWAGLAGVLDGKPAWGGDGDLSRPIWWLVNGLFASAYLTAIVMAYDGDTSDDDFGGEG